MGRRPVERTVADAGELSLPPGPPLPRPVQAVLMAFARPAFLQGCLRRYGTCFTVRLPAGATFVVVADPAMIKAVFTGDPDLLFAGEAERMRLEPIVGRESVYLLDGNAHLRWRRLMSPLFHGEMVRGYGELARPAVLRQLRRAPSGRPIPVHRLMHAIHLELSVDVVLGIEAGERRENLKRLLDRTLKWTTRRPRVAMAPWLQRGSRWGPWAWMRRDIAALDEALFEEIRARRSNLGSDERPDVLSALLRAAEREGTPVSDRELRDQLVTLFVTGLEPMAAALPAALLLLLRNPPALARLRRELEDGQGVYLEAVVREALRLEPGRTLVGRRLRAPLQLNGYLLPAGTTVTPSIRLTHRLPEVYADPLTFRPERFLERAPDTYTWIPFGGGTRRCVAAGFATLEMKTVIATILTHGNPRLATRRAAAGGPRVILDTPR